MKLLLVMPSQYTPDGELFKRKKAFFPSLVLPHMAGLTPGDIEVAIRNDYIEEIDFGGGWDLAGISISTLHSARGYELAAKFRERGIPVVMGGFHATFMPDEAAGHCDAVVVGEAESVWASLLDDFRNGALKKRYEAKEPHSLKGLPRPRFDLIPFAKYHYRSVPLQTSRGCPFHCEYCSVTQFYGRSYRFRPVEEVVEEVRAATRIARTRNVLFIDDNIAARSDYSRRLFEALIPLKIIWISQCALTMADDVPLLKLAARAGMKGAFIGVETLSTDALKKAGKRINKVKDYAEKLARFRHCGIYVSANMIFGFDGDNDETFRSTFWFLVRAGVYANPYILTPYPGTRQFERMKGEGRLLHTDWRHYTAYQAVFRHDVMQPAELESKFWGTYLRLYGPLVNLLRIFRRPLKSLLSPTEWALNFLMFYNATFKSRRYIKRRLPPYF